MHGMYLRRLVASPAEALWPRLMAGDLPARGKNGTLDYLEEIRNYRDYCARVGPLVQRRSACCDSELSLYLNQHCVLRYGKKIRRRFTGSRFMA